MDIAGGGADPTGNLALGVALRVEKKAGFLLLGQRGERGFQIELGEELLVRLMGEPFSDLKLGRAERFVPLFDLVQIEIPNVLAVAQRSIPCRDPDR